MTLPAADHDIGADPEAAEPHGDAFANDHSEDHERGPPTAVGL
jgi:hypothetical protein